MIKSLSNYYLTIPFVDPSLSVLLGSLACSKYTLKIYVWDGLKASIPATASYEMTKQNIATSNGSDKVSISNLINDYIDFMPTLMTGTGIYDGNNQNWVSCKLIYTTVDPLTGDDMVSDELDFLTDLMVQGYAGGLDGENGQTPTSKVFISGDDLKAYRSGNFIVPVLLSESTVSEVTIKSYPDLEIDETINTPSTTNSAELVQNIWINLSETFTDKYVEVVYNGVTKTILITEEYKYTPMDICFQNKEGVLQIIPFFKAKTESLTITSEDFQSDRGQAIDGNHQMVTYNVQGNSKFKMNSGFVDESMNENFKQLFLSERVWHFDGTNYIPLKLGSKSLEYKTRLKDRLINYEIEFEYAFNEKNNV